eukprot:scaffold579_cov546-Prasinococcus_capsulatus_cf.AAC.10
MSLSVVSHTVVNFQTHRNTGSSTGLRKPRCIRLSRKSASASPRGARRMVVCMSEGPEITKKVSVNRDQPYPRTCGYGCCLCQSAALPRVLRDGFYV